MSDIIDDAQAQCEQNDARSLKYYREQSAKPIEKSKTCYWCNESTINGRRFCNSECRDMWQEFGEK